VRAQADVVDQGSVPSAGGARWHDAVSLVSHHAFLSGLRLAMIVGAAATLIGTACGPFIRATVGETDGSAHLPF
jgi:hypothetical protein